MTENDARRVPSVWKPIADLPDNWRSLGIPELSSLASVWAEQHNRLKESRAVKAFNERLAREWSIETGILERLYTIDRGVTQLLVEQGIDAALIPHGATNRPVSEVVSILQDHCGALEGIYDFVASGERLSISYIRQLHQAFTRHQQYVDAIDQFGNPVSPELQRGDWKKQPNNPTRPDGSVYEYCPPLQVPGEMERLLEFHHSHTDVPPEVSAAWLHHRFTQIHPFQDGNGRVARALATIVFIQAGWFPMVVNRDARGAYIAALEAADYGDLAPLVRLFGLNAKQAFTKALTLSEDVLSGEVGLPVIVDSLAEIYETRKRQALERQFSRVETVADQLLNEANEFVREVAAQIDEKFKSVISPPRIRVTRSRSTNQYYYQAQIVRVAHDLGYWANIARPRSWVRLHLVDGQKTQIVFSFHYLGKVNRGVMICSGFVYFPGPKEEGQRDTDGEAEVESPMGETHKICSEPFTFSYQDEARVDDLKAELRKWMSDAISVGLAEWIQRV